MTEKDTFEHISLPLTKALEGVVEALQQGTEDEHIQVANGDTEG